MKPPEQALAAKQFAEDMKWLYIRYYYEGYTEYDIDQL